MSGVLMKHIFITIMVIFWAQAAIASEETIMDDCKIALKADDTGEKLLCVLQYTSFSRGDNQTFHLEGDALTIYDDASSYNPSTKSKSFDMLLENQRFHCRLPLVREFISEGGSLSYEVNYRNDRVFQEIKCDQSLRAILLRETST